MKEGIQKLTKSNRFPCGISLLEVITSEELGYGKPAGKANDIAQGEFAKSLWLEAPASMLNPRISEKILDEGRHYPEMDGKLIFKMALKKLPEVTIEVLEKAGLNLDDIDLFIPHQANMRINQFYQKTMNIPKGKVFHNIQRYGNTTAATIPLAMDEALEMKLIGKGSTLLFLGLGAGVTWGAVIYRFAG